LNLGIGVLNHNGIICSSLEKKIPWCEGIRLLWNNLS